MASTNNPSTIEVVTVSEARRRRWPPAEKTELGRQAYESGMSGARVARQHGAAASQLFNWRKLEREGALTEVSAGESVVPASELAPARAQIAQFHRLMSKRLLSPHSALKLKSPRMFRRELARQARENDAN